MSRLTMTLLAAAAAAIAATALVALPAVGDSGGSTTGKDPDVSHLAACLAGHGLPGAPTAAMELKQWLAGKESQDPRAVRAAIDACNPEAHRAPAAGPDAATLVACLRSHGLDAPAAPVELKRWVAEQRQAGRSKALDDALVACKTASAPPAKHDDAGRRDEKPGDTNTR